MEFKKIDPKELSGNVFEMIADGWALITVKDGDRFNTMTISWGGLGWLWRKPVAFTFVRPSRYTYDFMKKNDVITLSFFEKGKYRDQLNLLGSKSGRDIDKMKDSGLTPIEIDGQIAFSEATCVMVLKQLYDGPLPEERIQNVDKSVYALQNDRAPDIHDMRVSEVISCYIK